MATSIQPRGSAFQLRVVHKVLTKPHFGTFKTAEAAESYRDALLGMLDQGLVPRELAELEETTRDTLSGVVEKYLKAANPAPTEIELLAAMAGGELKGVRFDAVDYPWVEGYIRTLKVKRNLAPGTIRKRVGALARVLDWYHRRKTGRDQVNPFRLLPKGYSTYSASEAKEAPDGAKRDIQRDRRISPEELVRVRLALSGVKRADRERALRHDVYFETLFETILATGMRLSEAYKLRAGQIDFKSRFIRVAGSKGHRGALKPRVVPMTTALARTLLSICEGVGSERLVFPFWDGTEEGCDSCQGNLTARFGTLFRYAEVPGMTEHDLRHSACCSWFEMRNAQGHWAFSEVEIAKLMGWSNLSMVLRYASFRAQDLSARLD